MLILGMRVADFSITLFTVDKVIDHARLQGAGTEQRHQCDNIFKTVGTELANQLFHSPGFKLEYSGSLTTLHQFIGGFIVEGNLIDFQQIFTGGTAISIDHAHGPINNRQGTQSQKVELDQSCIFNIVLIELGDHPCPGLITVDRRKVGDLGGRNNYTTSVLAAVP